MAAKNQIFQAKINYKVQIFRQLAGSEFHRKKSLRFVFFCNPYDYLPSLWNLDQLNKKLGSWIEMKTTQRTKLTTNQKQLEIKMQN